MGTAELQCRINMNIPGLRKKKNPFAATPNNWRHPIFESWSSLERNGMLNQGLSRNWVRTAFPGAVLFLFVYIWQPLIHGNIYVKYFNNYSFETVYYKYQTNRMPMVENTITRIA